MPTGLDHVQNTLAICERLAQGVTGSAGVEETWKGATLARLEKVRCDLGAMQERFFLRSKLCLPFAARCEQEARKLEAGLGSLGSDGEAHKAWGSTLEALERAVKVLDDRSAAQGMVIT